MCSFAKHPIKEYLRPAQIDGPYLDQYITPIRISSEKKLLTNETAYFFFFFFFFCLKKK